MKNYLENSIRSFSAALNRVCVSNHIQEVGKGIRIINDLFVKYQYSTAQMVYTPYAYSEMDLYSNLLTIGSNPIYSSRPARMDSRP